MGYVLASSPQALILSLLRVLPCASTSFPFHSFCCDRSLSRKVLRPCDRSALHVATRFHEGVQLHCTLGLGLVPAGAAAWARLERTKQPLRSCGLWQHTVASYYSAIRAGLLCERAAARPLSASIIVHIVPPSAFDIHNASHFVTPARCAQRAHSDLACMRLV